jgi:glycosyltransferase involved in cell wall biosynthesis
MHVITRLNTGGATVHVVELSSALQNAGFDCLLVAGEVGPTEQDMRHLATDRGLRVTNVPGLGREISLRSDLVALARLYRLMRRERPHIVHTHLAKAGFVARLAARLARVPVVLHSSHGTIFQGYFSPSKARLFLLLERLGGRVSTRIVTSSESLRDDLVRLGIAPSDRITVIPYGFEFDAQMTDRRPGTFRDSLGIPRDVPLVGSVGRLVPIKNIQLLLEAVALTRQKGSDVRVVVVGDGELREELEARAQDLGLGEAVIFAGWQPSLADTYADLDAVVLSSNNEGTPISLIEAMAAGCPVVATTVGGVVDLITDGVTGRLVPASDPERMSDAILAVFDEPQVTLLMAERAQYHVRERHRGSARNADVVRLYEELLFGAGPGRLEELSTCDGTESSGSAVPQARSQR